MTKLIVLLLVFSSSAFAIDLNVRWRYDLAANPSAEGFVIYSGESVDTLVEIDRVPVTDPGILSFTHNPAIDGNTVCFGVSTYNAVTESSITTLNADGEPACFTFLEAPIEVQLIIITSDA